MAVRTTKNHQKMSSESEKAIRVLPFSGKKQDWNMWSKKFLARAKKLGYREILKAENLIDKDKKPIMNDNAYSDLLLAMNCEVAFGYVDEAVSEEFPEGDAALAWQNLLKKFQPNTTGSRVYYKNEFNNSKLGSEKDDPDEWIAGLEKIRKLVESTGSEISDEDFIIHVLNNLPKCYESLIDNFEKELDKDELTVSDMRLRLSTKYERMRKREGTSKSEDHALVVTTGNNRGGKKFSGRCSICGKKGHKAADCWERAENAHKKPGQGSKKGTGNFLGKCFICNKVGHRASECPERKKKSSENVEVDNFGDLALTTSFICNKVGDQPNIGDLALTTNFKNPTLNLPTVDRNLWLADTGASSHMRNSIAGMFDIKSSNSSVQVADGDPLEVKMEGKWRGEILQKNGEKIKVTLDKVKYAPRLSANLFSITRALLQGWRLKNDGLVIEIEKDGRIVKFDHILGNEERYIGAVHMAPGLVDEKCLVTTDVNLLHKRLGHVCEETTRAYAKANNIVLFGKFEKCVDCGLAKARQKNLARVANNKATRKGERIFLDVSSVRHESIGGSRFWVLLVDEFTKYKWSKFLKRKSDLKDKVLPTLQEINNDFKISHIRCDNAGENKELEKACRVAGMSFTFEYTAPNTPQQNGVVESGFRTLWNMVRAASNSAGFEQELREALWAECANTMTKIDNLVDGKFGKLYGRKAGYATHLHIFGEMCVIAKREKIQGKLKNKGKLCVFVGYADGHAADVFKFYDADTKSIIQSRDVTWLGKSYGEYYTNSPKIVQEVDEDDDFDEYPIVTNDETEEAEEAEEDEDAEVLPNLEDRKRVTWFDDELTEDELEEKNQSIDDGSSVESDESVEERVNRFTHTRSVLETLDEIGDMVFFTNDLDGVKIPENFDEAWNHPVPAERKGWRKSTAKEVQDMVDRNVWQVIKTREVPKNRRLVGVKWVFAKKKDGRFRPRIVAKGFMEIPGVDYSESFAPVVKDETFRVALVIYLVKAEQESWIAQIYDITTAFLYGDLDEEIYMRLPDGLEKFEDVEKSENCLMLNKAIYGLVQAARQFYKKLKKVLVGVMHFEMSKADPCLFYKMTKIGTCIICCYVDDLAFFGNKSAIENAVKDLQREFTMKFVGDLKEYVGCTIRFANRKGQKIAYLTQPDIIQKMLKKFSKEFCKMGKYKIPSGPGYVAVRPKDDSVKLLNELQKKFRSGVGTLLYLVKQSRPDIANSVREHAKVMDGATRYHYKELLRTMKFVADTAGKALVLAPDKVEDSMWKIRGICDSAFAPDPGTRRSVTGFGIYVMGCLVAWKSRSQRSVTLSSTEAEYVAMSELVQEIMFLKQILEFLKVRVNYPIIVNCDNVGVIFLAENATGQRTKHVDIRYHYVREFVDEGVVKIVFVRSEENEADLFTKNLNEELTNKHTSKYMENGSG